MRRITMEGLALLKRAEGLRLTAYRCPAQVLTIGYGHTGPDVREGETITAAEAEHLLRGDLDHVERRVAELVAGRPDTTDAEFSALVCLSYNIGCGALARSSVLRCHLAGDRAAAARAFGLWNKGGGKVLPGLVKRRAAEASLYRGEWPA